MLAVSDVYAEEAYFASTKLILPMLKFQLRVEYILLHFFYQRFVLFYISWVLFSSYFRSASPTGKAVVRPWCDLTFMWERFLDLEEAQLRLAGKPGRGRWWPRRRPPRWSSPPAAQLEASGRRPPSRSPNRSGCSFFLKRKPSRLPLLYSCILINSEE